MSSTTDAPEIHRITLDAAGIPISALLAEPSSPPRAVVVAIHGGGMSAGYFDSRARPGLSLLELGVRLGYAVLAVDRPGYGASTPRLPEGQTVDRQAATLHAALGDFAGTHETGAGFFLVAHSNGGKLALATAATPSTSRLIGLDISGLGSTLAVAPHQLPGPDGHGDWRRHWGSLRLYPPDAFRLGRALVSPVPGLEAREGPLWPHLYPGIAALVTIPVRFTFAEQELWWRFDDEAVEALKAPLSGTKVTVDHQPYAGHNISLGWAARSYHLRALGFLEECLLARDTAPLRRPRVSCPPPAGEGPDVRCSATHQTRLHM
ncbi:alpha/beta hydrolase [Streptomyces regalis]|uniref:alpha/beta hydrolase n=1 Tax=Streptomyces regalis TaxID=68262 RepID=UPI000AF86A96|nr:alpha/beta hydrolase [Streptomyces regalis]